MKNPDLSLSAKQTVLENTDIRVSRLAFGTASLHHLFSPTQRQDLLAAAAAADITHFDTSPYYGYGLAERDLGVFLRGRRAGFTLATKVGLYPWGAASNHAGTVWARKAVGKLFPRFSLPVVNWQVARARTSLHQSLRRLKTDYVDFLFLHEPDVGLVQADEFMRWIDSEHARGTVRNWGLAGVADKVAPWVQADHPLAKVVQTQDSLDKKQADFMLGCGRGLQFTYGYLSSQNRVGESDAPEAVLRRALQRNATGSVIVATRHVDRIAQLVKVAA